MDRIVNKIYLLIILYAGFSAWTIYEEKKTQVDSDKASIQLLRNKINKKKKEVRDAKAQLKDLEKSKANVERMAQSVEKLQRQLPSDINDAENIEIIKNISDRLNIKDVYVVPTEEVNMGFYFVKKYKYEASGTYLQFLIFLEKIGQNERLFNIESVEMEKSKVKQKGRYQLINGKITLYSYRYNENHREDREFKNKNQKNRKGGKKK